VQEHAHHGHHHRGGRAMARDVRDQHADLAVGELGKVVVVTPGVGAGGVVDGDLQAGQGRRCRGQQTPLDVADHAHLAVELLIRRLELALERLLLREPRAHRGQRECHGEEHRHLDGRVPVDDARL
jgi:hypothetical protein